MTASTSTPETEPDVAETLPIRSRAIYVQVGFSVAASLYGPPAIVQLRYGSPGTAALFGFALAANGLLLFALEQIRKNLTAHEPNGEGPRPRPTPQAVIDAWNSARRTLLRVPTIVLLLTVVCLVLVAVGAATSTKDIITAALGIMGLSLLYDWTGSLRKDTATLGRWLRATNAPITRRGRMRHIIDTARQGDAIPFLALVFAPFVGIWFAAALAANTPATSSVLYDCTPQPATSSTSAPTPTSTPTVVCTLRPSN